MCQEGEVTSHDLQQSLPPASYSLDRVLPHDLEVNASDWVNTADELVFERVAEDVACTAGQCLLPGGAEEGLSTKGDVDSEVKTVAAITSLSA